MSNQHWDVVIFGEVSRRIMGRPLGMYRIANHLRQQGYRVKCIWLWRHLDNETFDQIVKDHVRPGVLMVGISATIMFTMNRQGGHKFFGISDEEFQRRCELIKKAAPATKIAVGGAQISYADPASLKKYRAVDYFVSGQGETIMSNLVNSLSKNLVPPTNDITRPYIVSDAFYPFENFPDSQNLFQSHDGILPGEPLPLEIARGCIFKCSFCSYDLLGKNPNDYTKTLENLKQEFRHNHDLHGTTDYYIVDDIINESDAKVDLLYEAAQSMPFDMHFSGYLRLDLVRHAPARMKKLRDIGLYAGFFGIETVNDRSGRAVGKGLGVKRIAESFETMNDIYGDKFWGEAGMIMGLPYDDPDTKHRIMEWAEDPLTKSVIRKLSVQPLGILPNHGHSAIDRDPARYGYTVLPSDNRYIRLDSVPWKTAYYDSDRANEDSWWIWEKMKNARPWSHAMCVWSLGTYIFLEGPGSREQILDYARYNQGPEQFDIWYSRMKELYNNKRRNYLKIMDIYK